VIKVSVGDNIRYYRKSKGLSRADFDRLSYVGVQWLQKVESNSRKNIRMSKLVKIKNIFNVSLEELVYGEKIEGSEFMSLAKNLRKYREKNNLSYDEMEKICGVDKVTLYQIEKEDIKDTNLETAKKICAVLRITLDDLFEDIN